MPDFIDFSEIEVFGGPAQRAPERRAAQRRGAREPAGDPVLFGASFTDPDSKITGYRWDFDGNGTVDRTTEHPDHDVRLRQGGDFTARPSR